MQTAGFISEYLLLDFFVKGFLTSLQKYDAGISFSSFDFIVNFLSKSYLYHALP